MNYLEFNAPDILFRPAINRHIYEIIINPKVDDFLKIRGSNLKEVIRIDGRKSITDLNFKKIKLSYFYNRLLENVKKKSEKGFTWTIFYTITFDKKLATKECSETGLMYNEMYLGKFPIMYFIYFDLQEILDKVRELLNNNF